MRSATIFSPSPASISPNPVTRDDVVWTYSGVRPLYNDGAKSATAATRDYVLKLDEDGPPLLNVFGGKITTYRRLAESALAKLSPFFPQAKRAGLDRPRGFAGRRLPA
jgi:glycerol-3-phosphate dehydrogenase